MHTFKKSTARIHLKPRLLGAISVAALGLAACGSGPVPISAPADAVTDAATEQTEAAPAPTPIGPAAITSSRSSLGDILVGSNGLAVYGFTNDVDAASVCYGTCAEAWPPLLVNPDWNVAPDLDAGIFNAVARDDGQLQLVAGKWPLYYFAGDAVPADLNGQGSGGVWFAVGTDGALITDDATGEQAAADDQPTEEPSDAGEIQSQAVVEASISSAGEILVDDDGLSLYGFLDDDDGRPTCDGACADAWPPLLLDSAELPAGLDDNVFAVVERSDGRFQLKAGVWPLYRFAGDASAGDINGQGSGDVWFLATPNGGLVQDLDEQTPDPDPDTDPDTDTDY